MKAIEKMSRREVVLELTGRLHALDWRDHDQALKEFDAIAVKLGCHPGKIPARAALAWLRRSKQLELALS